MSPAMRAPDGVHYTMAGYKAIARMVEPHLPSPPVQAVHHEHQELSFPQTGPRL